MKTKTTPKKKSAKVKARALSFKAYMLRTCAADRTAYGGFKWPKSGEVKAPDWKNDANCGNGLHGLLWGEGDGSMLNWDPDAMWMVCGINEWVELNGKVKAPKASVVYCGTRIEATALIAHLGGARYLVAGGIATAGDYGTATAGEGGTILVKWLDGKRYRFAAGYCGENGIEPDVRYRCDDQGKLIKARP